MGNDLGSFLHRLRRLANGMNATEITAEQQDQSGRFLAIWKEIAEKSGRVRWPHDATGSELSRSSFGT
jgi:hypothetical protein